MREDEQLESSRTVVTALRTIGVVLALFASVLAHAPLASARQEVPPAPSTPPERPINDADDAPLASIDPATGRLRYGPYANQGQTNADHIIPDFSHAGYGGGGVALPAYDSIPILITIRPQPGDDHNRIQTALETVGAAPPDARGIRGAVYLEAGLYEVSDELVIANSGVVLRGAGQGPDGTIVRATTTTTDADLIRAVGEPAVQTNTTRITQSYVPVGSVHIEVASSQGYSVGDRIFVTRTPNDTWVGPEGVDTAQFGWTAESYAVSFQRAVVAIDDNTLTLNIPIVDTIEDAFGGGEVSQLSPAGRLAQVGIENLRLETRFETDVKRTDRAFRAVYFSYLENSWIRDVSVRYFSHGFYFADEAYFSTAQNVAFLDPNFEVAGGEHYAFVFNGGSGQNLYQRCYAHRARHAFVLGSRATGPSVFLDCLSVNPANDSGPHHRWSTGTLFDNLTDNDINVQNRATSGSGHGWAGAQQMIWNSVTKRIKLQAPHGAMNWAVGNRGNLAQGQWRPNEPRGIVESQYNPVEPRSLYLQQLQDRFGQSAVVNVASPEQLTGIIYDQLEAWAGDSALIAVDFPVDEVMYGDVNCDGSVDNDDAALVIEYLVGTAASVSTCAIAAGGAYLYQPAADVDSDLTISIRDALTIAHCTAGDSPRPDFC